MSDCHQVVKTVSDMFKHPVLLGPVPLDTLFTGSLGFQRQFQPLWYHCCPHWLQVTKVMASSSGPPRLTQAGRNRAPLDTCVTSQSDPPHLSQRIFCVRVPSTPRGSCLSFTPRDEYSSLSCRSSALAISSADIRAKVSGPREPLRRPRRRCLFLGFLKLATLLLTQALYLIWLEVWSRWMCRSMFSASCAALSWSGGSGRRAARRSWTHLDLTEERLQDEDELSAGGGRVWRPSLAPSSHFTLSSRPSHVGSGSAWESPWSETPPSALSPRLSLPYCLFHFDSKPFAAFFTPSSEQDFRSL